jgi:hypothetical protein
MPCSIRTPLKQIYDVGLVAKDKKPVSSKNSSAQTLIFSSVVPTVKMRRTDPAAHDLVRKSPLELFADSEPPADDDDLVAVCELTFSNRAQHANEYPAAGGQLLSPNGVRMHAYPKRDIWKSINGEKETHSFVNATD